jgi:hypothetical protein
MIKLTEPIERGVLSQPIALIFSKKILSPGFNLAIIADTLGFALGAS